MSASSTVIVVTGSRYWAWDKLKRIRETLLRLRPSRLILGDATGVDAIAKQVAIEECISYVVEEAYWHRYGRGAGPERNGRMLDHGPDIVVYFHDSLEHSRGTKNCVKQARARGIEVVQG